MQPSRVRLVNNGSVCSAELIERRSRSVSCLPFGGPASDSPDRQLGFFGCYNDSAVWTTGGCSGVFACGAADGKSYEERLTRSFATCGRSRERRVTFICECVDMPSPFTDHRESDDLEHQRHPRTTIESANRGGRRAIVLERPISHHVVAGYDHSDRVTMVLSKVGAFGHRTGDRPDCPTQKVGKHFGGADAEVQVCPANYSNVAMHRIASSGDIRPLELQPSGLGICVPSLYVASDQAAEYHKKITIFMHYYRRQSYLVNQFFIYACEVSTLAHHELQASDVTAVLVPWCATIGMLSRGQNLVINDCIQRASAAGLEWVLSCDIDELLAVRPDFNVTQLLSQDWLTAQSRSSVERDRPVDAYVHMYHALLVACCVHARACPTMGSHVAFSRAQVHHRLGEGVSLVEWQSGEL